MPSMPIFSQKSTEKLEFPAMQAGDQEAPAPKSPKAGKGVMLRGLCHGSKPQFGAWELTRRARSDVPIKKTGETYQQTNRTIQNPHHG